MAASNGDAGRDSGSDASCDCGRNANGCGCGCGGGGDGDVGNGGEGARCTGRADPRAASAGAPEPSDNRPRSSKSCPKKFINFGGAEGDSGWDWERPSRCGGGCQPPKASSPTHIGVGRPAGDAGDVGATPVAKAAKGEDAMGEGTAALKKGDARSKKGGERSRQRGIRMPLRGVEGDAGLLKTNAGIP